MEKEVQFEFLGQVFTFKANASEEEVKEVLKYLDKKKEEIEDFKKVPAFKLAIWLLLQVAYDYIKIKKEKEALKQVLREQVVKLDSFLEKEKVTLGCA
jgi:cell division protein ZapA